MIDGMEELPQVVWLRGDEPYCGSFTLDAEAVMQRLGIKRTRLTQISGRELRVGRIRRGRYVAPVYRAEDVDAYAAWTRPTAAHLKSSQVLEDAARALAQQGDVVAERVHDDLEHLLAEVADDFRTRGREQERLADARLGRITRRLDELEARAAHGETQMQDRLVALLSALTGMRAGLDRVTYLLEAHNRDLAETKAVVARLAERTSGIEGGLEPRFALLEAGLGAIEDRIDGARTALSAALAPLAADVASMKASGEAAAANAGAAEALVPAPVHKLNSVYRRAARRRRV